MKKLLTLTQHEELIKLGYTDREPNIGGLIEFIDENNICEGVGEDTYWKPRREWWIRDRELSFVLDWDGELIDALFEAVKEVLQEKKNEIKTENHSLKG